MEQIPGSENKNNGLHLDLKKMSPQERRETFLKLLGLYENATEEEMKAFLDKEHKEFNLEDFKKKEGPVGKTSEEQQLEKFAESIQQKEAAAVPIKARETSFLKIRKEFSPWQVERVSELAVGKKYRLNNETTGTRQDVIVDAVPYPKGSGFYVRVKDTATGAVEEKSCQDIGVTPYQGSGGELSWNPDSWVEPLE